MENEPQNIEIESQPKRRFFLNHKKSSALVVTITIHAVFVAAAISFVVVQAMRPEPAVFAGTEVPRPQPKLKKIEIPVKDSKKNKAPKLRQMITTKPNVAVNLQMPEMVGIKGGSGYGKGTGLGGMGLGFDFDLFGGGSGSGNELIGTFYDLKQEPDGKPSDVGEALLEDKKNPRFSMASQSTQDLAMKVIDSFVGSGFNPTRLDDYFKAPKLKYAKAFMMPPMNAGAAPEAFGVQDQVEGSLWICHYKGQIAAPETGRYRFCGIGDDVLIVRVGRKIVLDACWPEHIGKMSSWESDDDNNRRFSMNSYRYGNFNSWNRIYEEVEKRGGYEGEEGFGNVLRGVPNGNSNYMSAACRMVIGDWVDLRKGQLVNIDILIGELPGGDFTGRLLIEQQGKEYKMVESDAGPRPVLPIFKTVDIDNQEMIKMMELDPREMTLDGPVFGAKINSAK
ncbi:MAG: hypothetical protein JXR40_05675 [Pontiellaceae bacterium]|nr:hypothetical protein [Pontiellaceae bacterium]